MEKKGFTLAELIGVIVIISILLILSTVSFIGIRKTILQNQYNNLIQYLSAKAANYTEETGELNVTVERLIEIGTVEADDDNILRDPRNNDSLNCLIFDSKYENGSYNATPNHDIGLNEDGRCNKYEVKKEMQICVMEGSVCNTQIANWYNRNVVLSVIIGGNQELVNNADVTWKVDGEITKSKTYTTNISSINKGIYTADVKYEELRPDGTTKIIQGVEIAAINIDLVKPEVTKISINKEEQWTNENKKVTINLTDNNGSGVSSIAIVGKNINCSTITSGWDIQIGDTYVTALDNGEYNVCVQDVAGNISDNKLFEIKKIDKIAPTCSINVATPDGDNGWYTSKPINLTLVTDDNVEGNIAHGLRRDDNNTYYNNISSINHTEDVEGTIYYGFVKDMAGNEANCSKEISLDTINPGCNITITGDKTISGSEWYTSEITITLVETKGTSAIVGHNLTTSSTISYKYDTNPQIATQNNTTGISYYGYVKGASGREGSCEKTNIKVDTIKPSIGTITYEDTATSGQKVIKTRISDNGSKLMAYAVTTNSNPPTSWQTISGSPETYDISYKTTNTGTHYIWAKDNAGNVQNQTANVILGYDQITKVRYENVDGTWGSYTIVETKRVEEGKTYSWSTSSITNFDSTTYQAASVTSYTVTGEKTNQVNIYRKTFTCKIGYKLQKADGTYENTTNAVNSTLRYGQTCSYSRTADTTYQAASYSSTITNNINETVNVLRKTFTVTKRYRLQGTDGTYPSSYTADGTATALYGSTYTYSRAATTSHQAASITSSTITGNTTVSLDVPRKTVTVTKRYKLQGTDGTYPSSYTSDGIEQVLYGANYTYSKSATTTHQAASTSASNITAATTLSLDVPRVVITCNKQYRLQNADGTWGSYTNDGSITTVYGGSCSYSKTVTNYKGSSGGTNGSAGSASASNVTGTQTLQVSMYRNTFTITKRYRLQGTDGTYPSSYTADGTATALYGSTYTYSRAATTSHQAATTTSSTITGNVTLSLDVPRKTVTITKRYRLQGTDGTYPSSYTADGTATALYGSTYTYSRAATTSHQMASTSASNITAATTLSLDVPRVAITCNKQYRLQNADGTWGNYTADGSVTTVYGGSCSYSKTVTDYKGSSSGTNGSAGSASASNVTSNQTLQVSMYRNTFTLTVTAGTNTSSATGGGAKRWGQSCTVGVTKAANTTCISYATPTWTASTGTAPAAGASSTYTMPKSNATVTATSAASNVSQTITLSKGIGVSGIKIGSTNYTGSSVSLTCGTYNISGNLNAGYSFLSWARANGVAVASTSNASTTMTVSGAGTLTLNGKANTYNLVITGDDGVSGFSVKAGSTSGTTTSCTKSENKFTCSSLANGTNYYLYPTFNSGFNFGSYTKTDSATNAQLGSTSVQNTYYKMGAGAGAITISSKLGLCDDLDHCMQTATMENCGNTKKDARDGKSYTTAIIGTECWMTKNLSLAGGTALTSVLSNVASSYTIPASDCSASYGSDPVGTFMCNDNWGKGAYYSWNIAVAGSATVPTYGPDNPAPSDLPYESVAPYDICPKRWKLPTSFGQISNAVCERDGGTRYCYPTGSPFYGELNGHPLYSGQDRIGDFGFLWASTYSPRVYGCEVVNGQVGCGYAGGINSLYIRSNLFTYLSETSGHAKGIRCILK